MSSFWFWSYLWWKHKNLNNIRWDHRSFLCSRFNLYVRWVERGWWSLTWSNHSRLKSYAVRKWSFGKIRACDSRLAAPKSSIYMIALGDIYKLALGLHIIEYTFSTRERRAWASKSHMLLASPCKNMSLLFLPRNVSTICPPHTSSLKRRVRNKDRSFRYSSWYSFVTAGGVLLPM